MSLFKRMDLDCFTNPSRYDPSQETILMSFNASTTVKRDNTI